MKQTTEQRSLGTIAALIRTAEWAVENARAAHRDAALKYAESESQRDIALARATEAEQLIRDLMSATSFSADSLGMATLNKSVLLETLEQQQQMLQASNEHLEDARQQLMTARTTLQLYQRLRDRKSAFLIEEKQRQSQRDLDTAGTTLKIYKNSDSKQSGDKEMAYGY